MRPWKWGNAVRLKAFDSWRHRCLWEWLAVVGTVVVAALGGAGSAGAYRAGVPVGPQVRSVATSPSSIPLTTAVLTTAPLMAPTIPDARGRSRADVGVSLPSTTVPARVFVSVKDSLSPVCQSARGAVALPVGPTLGCRIVAAYGNPLSKGMGILGRLPRDAMLADLAARTASWQKADPARSHRCALELIAISVQAAPGASGLYRARMGAELIDRVLGWARGAGCLLILDVQVGHSSVAAELPFLEPWLAQRDVHLGLDPEWDMPAGVKPGSRIGTMDAADINTAVDALADLVTDKHLPPKLLVVHRFLDSMVTNPGSIRTPPQIRLVVNMDGFGPEAKKRSSYRVAKANMPTPLTGFKLFTLIDRPMLEPAVVLTLDPAPVFINYQ